MATRTLGRNGPKVSALGFGLAGISYAYGEPLPEDKTFALLDKAIELGATFWDSSDAYGDNSERLNRYFAQTGNRDKVFLASKVGIKRDGMKISVVGDPEYVRSAVDKVLERLGVPHVDIIYMHRLDPNTPVELTVGALAELVKAGKARYIGLSECSSASLRRAYAVHPIAAVQVEYSPFSLDIEDPKFDLLRTCRELGVAVVAYSPLGRGILGGKIRSRADLQPTDARLHFPRWSEENFPKNLVLVDKLRALAEKKGVTIGQLTLAWVLAQGDDIIPIPGTTEISRLEENVGALKVQITPEEDKEIRSLLTDISGDRAIPGPMAELMFTDTPPLEK
ncbi:aldo-keto reductase [Exidia glandulosa HHB12029]|uniref:Aldo-keto reductase n=1 Tax=Exidia glandulosa HHB12029 TaxID=1314781 RepID=A0A165EUK5_EXIGL|nr:aldo-keto reductase [Exidia glandulosa HHB12029]